MRTVRIGGWLREFYYRARDDEDVRPTAQAGDAGFHDACHPAQDLAGNASPAQLARMFEAWLLLNHGSGYRLIKDPVRFRSRAEQAARRAGGAGRRRHPAPDASQYDLAEICEPRLYGNRLRCYVEDRVNGVPYRVDLSWPIDAQETARFQLLPLLQDQGADYI